MRYANYRDLIVQLQLQGQKRTMSTDTSVHPKTNEPPGTRDLSNTSSVCQEGMALDDLAEQVSKIAFKLDQISKSSEDRTGKTQSASYISQVDEGQLGLIGSKFSTDKLAINPQFLRKMIKVRQKRALFFNNDLFSEPAWDMLLDLAAANAEGSRVSVTSLCIASGVPATTALRWISNMIEAGIFKRVADQSDKRRRFVELTDKGIEAMKRYFETVYFEEMSLSKRYALAICP